MRRAWGWLIGAGLVVIATATPARAQVHFDITFGAPHVGARVVVGGPRLVVVDRYDRHDRHRGRDWNRGRGRDRDDRDYDRDVRDAEREYREDVRKAEREYRRDLEKARREYEKEIRDARRDRRRW